MALNGIGGNAAGSGSALEKFQQIRDLAKKKLDGDDKKTNLADLIKSKQTELGGGATVKGMAERIPPALAAPSGLGISASAGSAGRISTAYGRGGAVEKQDTRPTLGRYVDFMA